MLHKIIIVLGSVTVGTIIVGKCMIQNTIKDIFNDMNDNKNAIKKIRENCFTINRLIDADCDGKALTIGINGKVNPNNILSHQGIRLGQDGKIKRLISFLKVDNGLVYNFEDNTRLILIKNDKNKIVYSFEMPGKTIVKEMDDKVIGTYNTIGVACNEIDQIAELKESKPVLQ